MGGRVHTNVVEILDRRNLQKIPVTAWNPNDPCFGWKRPCFGGLTFKNRGHLGSRWIYKTARNLHAKKKKSCSFNPSRGKRRTPQVISLWTVWQFSELRAAPPPFWDASSCTILTFLERVSNLPTTRDQPEVTASKFNPKKMGRGGKKAVKNWVHDFFGFWNGELGRLKKPGERTSRLETFNPQFLHLVIQCDLFGMVKWPF